MSAKLTTVEDALAQLLAQEFPRPSTREVGLADALDCVIARDVIAALAVPAFDNSAMDGYAVYSEDCRETGSRLRVSQVIAAGHPGVALQRGTAARIFTGAPLPEGADAVVMQENTEKVMDSVVIRQEPVKGENVRLRGHDIAAGSKVLSEGQRLSPQDIGLLASLGEIAVSVFKPLTVGLLNTGDELAVQGEPLRAGQLYDSNSHTLAALLQRLRLRVVRIGIVGDDKQATMNALKAAATQTDCIISTGGVSVGDADHVRAAVEEVGKLSLWKLAMKPGKPFAFGHVGKVPFFGLPGNPVAVFVTFALLVQPFLLRLQGVKTVQTLPLKVRADFATDVTNTRQEYLRVQLRQGSDGFPHASLFADQSSSVLTSLSWADGLAILPIGKKIALGDWLDYLPLRALV